MPNDSCAIPQPTSETPLNSSSASDDIVSQSGDIVNRMWAVLTKNAVWEEFVADAFALMNNYSEDYVDTAVDYWYNDDIADRYSPAEYIKDMDAGGNKSVLDNIGFGNEYSLTGELKTKIKYSKKGLLLPKNEYAKFKSSANTDYHKGNKSHVGLQYQSCVGDKTHILYVYEDRGFDNYNVLARIDYADEDAANIVAEVIGNEKVNGITALVNRVLQIFEARQSGYTVYNADSKKRSGSRGDDSLFERKAKSNAGRIDGESGIVSRNKRGVKYSLNVYDSDAESLTPERKKEIFAQWERDHAERQNWENNNNIIVYENDEQFENFAEKVLKNEDKHKKIYFGKIPTDTAQMILDKPGVDVSEHNIALKGYEIRKILLNSHGDENLEIAIGQEPITVDDLKKI